MSNSRGCACAFRRRQKGQALPLGIAFVMVGFLGAFVLFNTGQMAVNKQRLSDAADSAAYSGMVWQARALNFQAYTNRAMMANDVSIGQAVSLNSWSHYSVITTENIKAVIGWVPILREIASTIAQIMDAVNRVVDPLTQGMVMVVDAINGVIDFSQEAMFASAFLATPDIVDKVARASDEGFRADSLYGVGGLVMNLRDWNEFTEKYEHDNEEAMIERTDMISDSRDGFSDGRNWKFMKSFWMYSTPLTKHRVFYDGETRLLMSEGSGGEPKWEWVAKDTVSFHTKTYWFKRFKLRSRVVELPIGWAAAYASSDGSVSDVLDDCENLDTLNSTEPCDFLPNNGTAEKAADAGLAFAGHEQGPYEVDGYSGVREFRSLSQAMREDPDGDPVLRLRAEVTMDIADTQTSSSWVHDSKPFATELVAPADKMSSISIAEVYYRHPKAYISSNEQIARQKANGYNPYWDVRLVPVELTERLVALGLRGDLSGADSSAPGNEQIGEYGSGNIVDGVDLGGNISANLPEYATTLAESVGLTDAAEGFVREQVAQYTGLTLDSIPEFMSEDEIKDKIQDELEERLKHAVEDMLRGWVRGSLGVTDEQIDFALAEAEEVTQEAEAFVDKMESIQEAVADDFDAALMREVPLYEETITELRRQLQEYSQEAAEIRNDMDGRDSPNDSPYASRYNWLQGQMEGIRGEIITSLEELKEALVDEMMASVMRHGSEFFPKGPPRQLMEEGILEMIDDYLSMSEDERNDSESEGLLPWEDDEDEEETDDGYSDEGYAGFEK